MKVLVGTSGYSYKAWLGNFYPDDLATKEMLHFYASRLPAVEINNTFYRLPKESVLRSWAEQVPTDFQFALKAPQKITHVKRLRDAGAELEYLFRVAPALGPKLGAILFQQPPNLRKDLGRLENFLSSVPDGCDIAFEFRHPSWFDQEVFACLRARNCALCIADTDGDEEPEIVSTASWGYLRLRRSQYDREDVDRWRRKIVSRGWNRAYVFFKHEDEGIGPKLAAEFLALMKQFESQAAG